MTTKEQYRERCDAMLTALLGPAASKWWTSPNRAFDFKTPDEVFEMKPTTVFHYLVCQCAGDYS